MLAKRTPPPRFLETRGARFRLAYDLYGWKVLLVCLWVVPFMGLAVWVAVTHGKVPLLSTFDRSERGFGESEDTIFHEEVLFAAAHRYAREHDGRLPASETWQAALRPYLSRAGAASALNSFTSPEGTGRFVMNRALSGTTIGSIPNAPQTLLFWQAITNRPDLVPSTYQKAPAPFGGVACDGTTYTLEPTGNASEPLFWRRAEHYRPEPHHAESIR